MKLALLLFALLPAIVSAQSKPTATPSRTDIPLAPISCTLKVPTVICKDVVDLLSGYQQLQSMRQVEIILADEEAFKQEHDRVWARFQQQTADAVGKGDFSTLNRKPVAPCASFAL